VRRVRLTWRRGLLALAVVLVALVAALWFIPSGDYLVLPHDVSLVEPLVEIPTEGAQASDAQGGIYLVDVLIRRANLLEQLIPWLNRGATFIPERDFNPVGVSEEQRHERGTADMTRSQQIAAAVALRSLGYDVEAEPDGAEVVLVLPGSPADRARFEPGDVIVSIGGKAVATLEDVRAAMAGVKPGATVAIGIQRDGQLSDHQVETTAAEDDPERAFIGVQMRQAANIDLPVKISIDAKSLIGPSAGLAFALDIVDELGTDVDQGRRVVATGEIQLDGTVREIGGIKQKTIGAGDAGADVFVVPDENAEEARKYADGLEIVSVGSFDEALEKLGAEPAAVS
jgi:PDZ domain-containing protein